jgi:hypothetical protein
MTMDQSSIALIAAACGVGGVLIGHYLTRSWQREQWLLDRRKEEYRELISALSTVFTNMQRFGTGVGDRDFNIRLAQVNADSYRVIRDRIFIADEIAKAQIMERWYSILGAAEDDQHAAWRTFVDGYEDLTKKLVQMAVSPPPSRLSRTFGVLARSARKTGRDTWNGTGRKLLAVLRGAGRRKRVSDGSV